MKNSWDPDIASTHRMLEGQIKPSQSLLAADSGGTGLTEKTKIKQNKKKIKLEA